MTFNKSKTAVLDAIARQNIFTNVFEPNNDADQTDHASEVLTDILRRYNQALIDHEYGITRNQLKQKDMIDLRPLMETVNGDTMSALPTKHEYAQAVLHHHSMLLLESGLDKTKYAEKYFYKLIPCFTEGVYQINTARYFYWNVKDVNIQDKTITVHLMDYMRTKQYWQPGVSCVAKITTGAYAEKAYYAYKLSEKMLFPDIYGLIPVKDLGWNSAEISIWESMQKAVQKYADTQLKKDNTDNCKELVKLFVKYTDLTNTMLYLNKPTKGRKDKTSKTSTSKSRHEIISDAEEPKKLIRYVGPLYVKSSKIPKAPTEKTIIHYKTASWKARGHIRVYKSGKTVYIKESIKRRKQLKDTNTENKPVLIKFKN